VRRNRRSPTAQIWETNPLARTEAGGRRTDFRVCKPQIRSGEGSNCKNIVLHILEYLIGNYAMPITPALSLP
jgi:hypothetical protein